MKSTLLNILIIFSAGIFLTGFKEPADNTQLFSIGRSKDANEIIYSLNLKNSNQLNQQDPIKVNWILRTENNRTEPLTWIQQKFSYGVVYLEISQAYTKFHFAGYSKRIFELKKNSDGKFNVYTFSEGREVIVNRFYIHISGGTFWIPEIPKVELHAILVNSGKNIIETIKT